MMHSVDVVILSWGRIAETCQAIDSALAQRDVDVRVFVVDQGTQADELAVLKAHCASSPKVVLVCNEMNSGVPGGRNQGSALGSAPFIVALDNDAEFASERTLADAVEAMDRESDVAVLAFKIILYSTGQPDRSSWPYPRDICVFVDRQFDTHRFVGAGHMIRRSPFDAIGGYDASLFFLHEEVDLAYRLINGGGRIVYSPGVAVRHKVSAENRVGWNGGRYFYHVRNSVYLGFKFNFSPLSTWLNVGIVVVKGLKLGFVGATCRGVFAGLALAPRAIRLHHFDPRVKLSAAAKQRIASTSARPNATPLQRLAYRLSTLSTRPDSA